MLRWSDALSNTTSQRRSVTASRRQTAAAVSTTSSRIGTSRWGEVPAMGLDQRSSDTGLAHTPSTLDCPDDHTALSRADKGPEAFEHRVTAGEEPRWCWSPVTHHPRPASWPRYGRAMQGRYVGAGHDLDVCTRPNGPIVTPRDPVVVLAKPLTACASSLAVTVQSRSTVIRLAVLSAGSEPEPSMRNSHAVRTPGHDGRDPEPRDDPQGIPIQPFRPRQMVPEHTAHSGQHRHETREHRPTPLHDQHKTVASPTRQRPCQPRSNRSAGTRPAGINPAQPRQHQSLPQNQGRDLVVLRNNTGAAPRTPKSSIRRWSGARLRTRTPPLSYGGTTQWRLPERSVVRSDEPATAWRSWPTEGRLRSQRGALVALWTCPGAVDIAQRKQHGLGVQDAPSVAEEFSISWCRCR
jgi:hypothetical protein